MTVPLTPIQGRDMLNRIRLQQYRGDPRWPTPIMYAVRQMRYEDKPSDIDFLNGFTDGTATGTYKGLDATVTVAYDEDATLGDDDVTGTFTDFEEEGRTIKNTARNWGTDYKFYRLSNYRYEEGVDIPKGMSKARIPEYTRWVLEQDMNDDANREYRIITATLSLDGEELADASLGWVDGHDAYIRETAENLLEEAYDVIPTHLGSLIANLEKRVTNLGKRIEHIKELAETLAADVAKEDAP